MGNFFEDSDDGEEEVKVRHSPMNCVFCQGSFTQFRSKIEAPERQIITDDESEIELDDLALNADDHRRAQSSKLTATNSRPQQQNELMPSRAPSSSRSTPHRHSSVTSISSSSVSPPPSKKRRLSPKASLPTQNSTPSLSHTRSHIAPKDSSKLTLTKPGYVGDFIVEAWATTSDTKSTTYIHPGDVVSITRSEAESSVSSEQAKKVKGKQTTLPFAAKSKPAPKAKKAGKENNIVRFSNAKGSGKIFNIIFQGVC